jgi:hypothetical protein
MAADLSPSTQTLTLIPVLSVDDARHGGVKVGSKNLGGENAFDPMSTAARLYWPHQQQTCWHRTPLNGNDTALVDENLHTEERAQSVPAYVQATADFCWNPVTRAAIEGNWAPVRLLTAPGSYLMT